MAANYEPLPATSDSVFWQYEIDKDVFAKLLHAGNRRNREEALDVIREHFPETLPAP